jgi:hypothetical protein
MLLQSCFSGMGRVTPRSIIRITFFYVLSMMQDFVPGRVFHHSSSQQLLIESTFSPTMRNRCAFVSRVVSSYRTNAVQGTLPASRGSGEDYGKPCSNGFAATAGLLQSGFPCKKSFILFRSCRSVSQNLLEDKPEFVQLLLYVFFSGFCGRIQL